MKLWHQSLIHYLPRQQLLEQYHEICTLRGASWGCKHSAVNYVFVHDPIWLVSYHWLVMEEMTKRGYNPDPIWNNPNYRGKTLGEQHGWCNLNLLLDYTPGDIIYSEHNDIYLQKCLEDLHNKGIDINYEKFNYYI